jgi:transposase
MMMDTDNTVMSIGVTDSDTSTHTSDRMSARKQRIEVITRGERRRQWSVEQKQAIVAESLTPGASLTAVAEKHGIGTGLLYSWRHQLLGGRPGGDACFARVELPNEPRRLAGPVATASSPACGQIEIVLPNGASVRVDAYVDARALRRVLEVLRG